MAKISDFRGLKNFSKWFNPEKIKNSVFDYLINEGEYIMRKAYESKDWQDRTFNLHDSYVCVVFFNGKPVRAKTFSPKSTKPRNYGEDKDGGFAVTGHEEAKNFIKSYRSTHGNEKGIKLVVAATMFYSSILESGDGNLKRKYRVISTVSAEFDRLKSQGVLVKTGSYTASPYDLRIPGILFRRHDIAEGRKSFYSGF